MVTVGVSLGTRKHFKDGLVLLKGVHEAKGFVCLDVTKRALFVVQGQGFHNMMKKLSRLGLVFLSSLGHTTEFFVSNVMLFVSS